MLNDRGGNYVYIRNTTLASGPTKYFGNTCDAYLACSCQYLEDMICRFSNIYLVHEVMMGYSCGV